jgi:acetyl esterase/lipase
MDNLLEGVARRREPYAARTRKEQSVTPDENGRRTLLVAAVLLAWTSLTYVKLRTTRNGMLWLLPKLAAGAFSLETALVGAAGAVVGAVGGSLSMVVGYALVALAAGAHVGRTWRTPEVFTGAFGASEPSGERPRYLLRRRWGVRLGPVPEARVRRDISFWIPPEPGRPLRCDVWQPAAEVPVSGLGLVYLHGSAWTLLDKDCGTRTLFRHLAAQGHVVMDVAYRLYPEADVPVMVGDAKRAVAWLKANAADYGVDPERVVLGGASAGGHVALLAAYTAGHPALTPADVRDADTSVCGVLGWYSPVDLAACYEHYENAALAQMMPDRPDYRLLTRACSRRCSRSWPWGSGPPRWGTGAPVRAGRVHALRRVAAVGGGAGRRPRARPAGTAPRRSGAPVDRPLTGGNPSRDSGRAG